MNKIENTNKGMITIPRSLLEDPIFLDPVLFQIFLQLVSRACYQDKIIPFTSRTKTKLRTHKVELKRGQTVIGVEKFGEKFGLTRQNTRTILKKLESFDYIKIEGEKNYSVITVLNYNQFQPSKKQNSINQETTNNQPSTNQELTKKQPRTNQEPTTKNKEKKEEKNFSKTDRAWTFIFKDFDLKEKEAYAFHELFAKFCEYRKKQGNGFKTEYYAKKQFTLLLAYSAQNFETAKEIVRQTIEEQRITFAVLKKEKNDFEDKEKQINDLGNNSAENEFNEW